MSKREHEVRLPDRFWRHCTHLSPGSKVMYCILLTFTDYNTSETIVGNARLERESGYGRDKVEAALRELEHAAFIKRACQYCGNLKSKRTIKCLKFVSDALKTRESARYPKIQGAENQGYILTESKSSLPSQSHTSTSSIPLPDPEKPERIM